MRHIKSPLQPQSPPLFLGAGAGEGEPPPLLPPADVWLPPEG